MIPKLSAGWFALPETAIEHWGRGTNRVVEAMREEHLLDPVFEELSGGFNVTLKGPGKAFEKIVEDQKLHKATEDLTGGLSGGLTGGLNVLYQAIRNSPGKKGKELSGLLARPIDTVDKQIKKLIQQGLVERKGSRKTGGYYAK